MMYHFRTLMLSILFVALVIAQAVATNGISVCTKGVGDSQDKGTVDGELWKFTIVADTVASRGKIYDAPVNQCRISPDGQWIAFIKGSSTQNAGKVCVMGIGGGAATELADCSPLSALEFSDNNWIHFTKGSSYELTPTNSDSKYLKRVSRTGGPAQDVVTFNWLIAQISISSDLTKAAIRVAGYNTSGSNPNGVSMYGRIIDYNMITGNGTAYRFLGGDNTSCGNSLSPDGQYISDAWIDHNGFDMRTVSDDAIVKSFSVTTFKSWPPFSNQITTNKFSYFATHAATNSNKWLCVGTWDSQGAQFLINWQDERTICPTKGLSGSFNSGDFWVANNLQPVMNLSKSLLAFTGPREGPAPVSQTITLTNMGVGTLADASTSISYGAGATGWLTAARTGSGNTQTITATVSPTSFASSTGGIFNATVTVTSAGADPASQTFAVAFTVTAPALLSSIDVSPSVDTILTEQALQFTAAPKDQYGAAFTGATVVWTVSDNKMINAQSGLFTADAVIGGPYLVIATATSGTIVKRDTARLMVNGEKYLTTLLALGRNGSMYIPAGSLTLASTIAGLSAAALPKSGDTVPINAINYTWSVMSDNDGIWVDSTAAERFVSGFAFYAISPVAQSAVLKYRNDDGLRIWHNGTLVVTVDSWDNGVEQTSPTINLVAGRNSFVIKFQEGTSENKFAINLATLAGNQIGNIEYRYNYSPITIMPPAKRSYRVGDTLSIVWDYISGAVNGAMIAEFSSDGGRNWTALSGAMDQGNPTYYTGTRGVMKWVIPTAIIRPDNSTISTASTNVKIRINSPYDPPNYANDVTGKFTIVGSGSGVNQPKITNRFVKDAEVVKTAHGYLLHANAVGAYSVSITTLAGQKLWSIKNCVADQLLIPDAVLSRGVHVLSVVSAGRTSVKKLIRF